MSAVLLVELDRVHVLKIVEEPRLQQRPNMACRWKRQIVVGDGIRDTRERVRETLALGIAIVGRSGGGESREAGLKASMEGETLGIL